MINPVGFENLMPSMSEKITRFSPPVEPITLPRQSVDGFDAELFSRLMQSQHAIVPATTEVSAMSSSTTGGGLGDKMLTHMSSMGNDFQKSWQEVSDIVAGPDNTLTMQDMLKAQMHMVRVSAEYEMIGKVIGKSTQNVDQMLRMQ